MCEPVFHSAPLLPLLGAVTLAVQQSEEVWEQQQLLLEMRLSALTFCLCAPVPLELSMNLHECAGPHGGVCAITAAQHGAGAGVPDARRRGADGRLAAAAGQHPAHGQPGGRGAGRRCPRPRARHARRVSRGAAALRIRALKWRRPLTAAAAATAQQHRRTQHRRAQLRRTQRSQADERAMRVSAGSSPGRRGCGLSPQADAPRGENGMTAPRLWRQDNLGPR